MRKEKTEELLEILKKNSYLRKYEIGLLIDRNTIFVTGKMRRYYHKQLVNAILISVEPSMQIVNNIKIS